MNYCDKIKYRIAVTGNDDFPVMIDRLLEQTPKDETVLRLAFFGAPPSNEEYIRRNHIIRKKTQQKFGTREPAVVYVSQPPLNAALVLEIHSFIPDADDRFSFHHYNETPYVVLENPYGKFLYAGGFQGNLNEPIHKQAANVFEQVEQVLKAEAISIHNIIRQWNYIQEITKFDANDQHYQSFNNARSDFYSSSTWPDGYPAATGIGSNLGGILIDLDAASFSSSKAYAKPIDNKLQVAAHAYSEQVLENACMNKTTPKFERAKSITFDNHQLIYVSGTAAIRGEESLRNVGLEKQLRITLENIAELTGVAKLVILRVYLKNPADYAESARLMNQCVPNVPTSFMWADVCREELLIEIEGIAVQ